MQCKACDYALWNISTGTCPECGEPYDVIDYRFEPGTVAFECPTCHFQHEGITNKGLPTEAMSMQCMRCGRPTMTRHLAVVPLTDDARGVLGGRVPFEDRQKSYRDRIGETITLVVSDPSQLGLDVGSTPGRLEDAYRYVLLLGLAIAAGRVLSEMLTPMITGGFDGEDVIVAAIGGFTAAFLWPFVEFLVWYGGAHLIIRAADKEVGTYEQTVRVMAYSRTPMLLGAVPVCGIFLWVFGVMWMICLSVMALSAAHRIPLWHAALAVLGPIAITVGVCAGVPFLFALMV